MLEVPRSKAGRRKYLEVTGAERAHPPHPALFIIITIISIVILTIIITIVIIFCVNVPTTGTRRRLPRETATGGDLPLSPSLSRLHTFPVSLSIYVQICNMAESNIRLLLLRCIFRPAAPGEPDTASERRPPPLHRHLPLHHDHLGHSLLLLPLPHLCDGLAIIGEMYRCTRKESIIFPPVMKHWLCLNICIHHEIKYIFSNSLV